jgi:hypothetical protein
MRRDDGCRECGIVPVRGARFCGHCGERLIRADPPDRASVLRSAPRLVQAGLVLAGLVAVATLGGAALLRSDHPLDRRVASAAGTAADPVLLPRDAATPGASGADDPDAPAARPARGACSGDAGPVDCVRWSTGFGRAEPRSVVIAGWTVAVADQDGRVRTFSAGDGRPAWRHTASGAPRFHDPVADTLPISGDGTTTFVDLATGSDIGTFAGRPGASAGSGPWLLVLDDGALEARSVTGAAAWRVVVPADGLGWVTGNGPYLTTPVSLRQDRLVRLSANTGQLQWEHTVRGRVAALHPLGSATLVAVEDTGDGAGVLVLERDGTVRLDHRVTGRVVTVVADPTGAAVVTDAAAGAELLLVDLLVPEVRGPVPLGHLGDRPPPLALGGDRVAVGLAEPAPGVAVVTRLDGDVEKQLALPATPRAVALPDARTAVAVVGSEVSAWSLTTGTRRWRLELGRPGELVSERPLLVRTDRKLVALDADPSRPRRPERGSERAR